jgi:hypothetical protein
LKPKKIGVSASAIKEVRINQNPCSAKFARPGRGRIEIITKPAADRFHGSGEFLFRDHRLDARNAFAATRPHEQRRIFGISKRQTEFSGSLTRQLGNRQALSVRYELSRDQGKGEGVGGFTLPESGSDSTERGMPPFWR